jgi:hypothetical protein
VWENALRVFSHTTHSFQARQSRANIQHKSIKSCQSQITGYLCESEKSKYIIH